MTTSAPPESKSQIKAIIVEDEAGCLEELRRGLSKLNISVRSAESLLELVEILDKEAFDIAFVSHQFKDGSGLVAAQKIRFHPIAERCGIVMMAGSLIHSKEEAALTNELMDIDDIQKPVRPALFGTYLAKAMKMREAAEQTYELRRKIGNYRASFGSFEKAVENVKSMFSKLGPRGILLLAELYFTAEKYDESMQLAKATLDSHPDNVAFLNLMGKILMKMGRHAEARGFLMRADKLAPHNIERMQQLVDLYLILTQEEKATAIIRDLIGICPELTNLKMQLMDKLFDYNYIEKAKILCREFTKPEDVIKYFNNRGVYSSKKGDIDDAIRCYERAIIYYPEYKDIYRIHFNLALALHNRNPPNLASALEAVESCLVRMPNFEKAVLLRQTLLTELYDRKK